MTKTTYLVGSKGTVLSSGKNSKCSHISSVKKKKKQPSFAKTFCCCQQVLVNFVEVNDDFAEIHFSLVSAIFQEAMGSCGCWRIWTGHCHVVRGWPHGSPGGCTACLTPRGAETGFACVRWSEGRFDLLSWSSGKVQGYPRWCQYCGLYFNTPFSFPSLSTTHSSALVTSPTPT